MIPRLAGAARRGTGLLDLLPVPAAAAYSFRKLRSDYAGGAIETLREDDVDVHTFGFVNDRCDMDAALSYAAPSRTLRARTWLDQSRGGPKNLQQTTAAQMPYFIYLGAGLTPGDSGIPSIRGTVGQRLSGDVLGGDISEFMLCIVGTFEPAGSKQLSFTENTSSGIHMPFANNIVYFDLGSTFAPERVQSNFPLETGERAVLTFINSVSLGRQEIWIDGVLAIADTTGQSPVPELLAICRDTGAYFHELLLFKGADCFAQQGDVTDSQLAYHP